MHRFVAGTCRMDLTLTPRGPWMVRGESEPEPLNDRGRLSKRDVLRPLLDARNRPVLPASSFKGVLRSTAERILRSMQQSRSPIQPPLADEPFVHTIEELYSLAPHKKAAVASVEDMVEKRRILLADIPRALVRDSELLEWLEAQGMPPPEADKIYPLLSPVSQLFGATAHAGLLRLDDAQVPASTNWRRSHVAIDRFTGGVGEGPFTEQLAPGDTSLTTVLTIENFALWQIGLMALIFQELNRGYTGIGGGVRKGQGHVRIDIPRVELRYAGAAYNVSSGVISAQARLRDAPWNAPDVPDTVYASEHNKVLLQNLEPQIGSNWRSDDAKLLIVQEDQVAHLFKEAVCLAWREWIQRETQEEPS